MQALVVVRNEAPSPIFLDVEVGALVTVKEKHRNGYYFVEADGGATGWVPESALQLGATYRVVAEFAAESSEELSVHIGQLVWIFDRQEEWAMGATDGQHGWLPSSFVQSTGGKPPPIPINDGPDPAQHNVSTIVEALEIEREKSIIARSSFSEPVNASFHATNPMSPRSIKDTNPMSPRSIEREREAQVVAKPQPPPPPPRSENSAGLLSRLSFTSSAPAEEKKSGDAKPPPPPPPKEKKQEAAAAPPPSQAKPPAPPAPSQAKPASQSQGKPQLPAHIQTQGTNLESPVRRKSARAAPASTQVGRPAYGKAAADGHIYDRFGPAGVKSNPLSYTLWAHNMALIVAVLCAFLAHFAILLDNPGTYDCKVEGRNISSTYLISAGCGTNNTAANYTYFCPTGKDEKRNLGWTYADDTYGTYEDLPCCCNDTAPAKEIDLNGDYTTGYLYLFMPGVIFLAENPTFGFGNWQPVATETVGFSSYIAKVWITGFNRRFRLQTLFYVLFGFFGWFSDATMLVGLGFFACGLCYAAAGYKQEAGDNSRNRKKQRYEGGLKKSEDLTEREQELGRTLEGRIDLFFEARPEWMFLWRPAAWYQRASQEGDLSTYLWVFVYVTVNIIIVLSTIAKWLSDRGAWVDGLEDGTFDLCQDSADDAVTAECKQNRLFVKKGVISSLGPFAKGFGMALNFNCALIVLPVLRGFLRWLNKTCQVNTYAEHANVVFASCLNVPIERFIPFPKNVEFHKMIGHTIFICATSHTVFHFYNYWKSSEYTTDRFSKWGWSGTSFVTGALICIAMFFIYSAATTEVRHSNYYVFFWNHHWFLLFFFMLFLHGPVFWVWALVPLLGYAAERLVQTFLRGRQPIKVVHASFTPNYQGVKKKTSIGVLHFQFQPVERSSWTRMKEGMYLYLNCPGVNPAEWHPFTISSARDDLFANTTMVEKTTGFEVYRVPDKDAKRANRKPRFLRVDKLFTDSSVKEDDYLERHEVDYLDYVSCHIKVSYRQNSWTRRLHAYLRDMAGGRNHMTADTELFKSYYNPKFRDEGIIPYSCFFSNYDERGDLQIGKETDVCAQPIIRIDGPHSAPSEHYMQYKTVMVVGAGVGMTPCASILTALLKYRWRKGQAPEILHFAWVCAHEDLEGFEWFVHMVTDLCYRLKTARALEAQNLRGAGEGCRINAFAQYYCEINIFVTRAPKEGQEFRPLKHPKHNYAAEAQINGVEPDFDAEQLFRALQQPKTSSKKWKDILGLDRTADSAEAAPNRFGDVFIWSGRPQWDDIFKQLRFAMEYPHIGVCFCGAPVIGNDLARCCRTYSREDLPGFEDTRDCRFMLHKENF